MFTTTQISITPTKEFGSWSPVQASEKDQFGVISLGMY